MELAGEEIIKDSYNMDKVNNMEMNNTEDNTDNTNDNVKMGNPNDHIPIRVGYDNRDNFENDKA